MQLLISNKGLAPIESFSLLGASGSRGDNNLIGQFGSGAKLAITSLLRKGLNVTVYSGLTRMCFKTETIEIEDREEQQVFIQFGGTSTKKLSLGWVLNFGVMDWQDEGMAIREFIANAIDRVNLDGGDLEEDMRVEIVPDSFKKAQSGYTRVFIETNDVVKDYVDDLPRRFLHFSDLDPHKQVLPKQEGRPKAQIYFNGVWMCELSNSADSLCDYNFSGSQVEIDESRNLNEYAARAAIGTLYQDASVDDLARVFSALSRGEEQLETGMEGYNIQSNSWESQHDQRCQNWRDAWEQVHGENAVACQPGEYSKIAKRKGYTLGTVKSAWLDTVKGYGIQTANDVLSDDDREGRSFHPPTEDITAAVDEVWEWIRAVGMDSKDKPDAGSFTDNDEDSLCLNLCRDGEVFLRQSLEGTELLEETLEVLTKYLTDKLIKQILIRWMA
jgi:hypothetical protein